MGFWEPLFFWIFAIGAVASSAMVVLFRNPLYSALFLILDFFFFAGLYVLLSAHFMAVTQILVYTGAIMVLFLFIIMLLNLKDDELGEFEFKLHHGVAAASVFGLFVLIMSAFMPVGGENSIKDQMLDQVREGRAQASEALRGDEAEFSAKQTRLEGIESRSKRTAELAKLEATRPSLRVATPSGVKPDDGKELTSRECATARSKDGIPGLFQDMNEAGLEACYQARVRRWASKDERARIAPSQGKWRRFDPTRPMPIPPRLTGESLTTERGTIRAGKPAGFGTIQPLSVLLVNRFVVPFQLTALLLLGAIVGAVIIAKRRL